MVYVKAPKRCLLCVYLGRDSGVPYCPFAVCPREKDEEDDEVKSDDGDKMG